MINSSLSSAPVLLHIHLLHVQLQSDDCIDRRKIKQAVSHNMMEPHTEYIRYCAARSQTDLVRFTVNQCNTFPRHASGVQSNECYLGRWTRRWWTDDGHLRERHESDLEWINKISFFFLQLVLILFKLLRTLSIPGRHTLLIYVAHLFFISHSCTFLLYVCQPAPVKSVEGGVWSKRFFSISLPFTLDLH